MYKSNEFYTLKGYASRRESEALTTAMEDYLEMIYRLYQSKESIRVKRLSENLHVRPSSVSKMTNHLKDSGYIEFEKYGQITLTEKGREAGEYLLRRHEILNKFFCAVNSSDDELTLVEKIEHFIDKETVQNMNKWLADLYNKNDI